jgi:signal transduction histidine kinase
VRNAIKYMGARPTRKIVVRASPAGHFARLEVEDTGPGIPAEIKATLFEPFVRGPHEDVNGTGLGLATVKRLVESHGGRVGVESTLGAGTLFWVELPLLPVSHYA